MLLSSPSFVLPSSSSFMLLSPSSSFLLVWWTIFVAQREYNENGGFVAGGVNGAVKGPKYTRNIRCGGRDQRERERERQGEREHQS